MRVDAQMRNWRICVNIWNTQLLYNIGIVCFVYVYGIYLVQ